MGLDFSERSSDFSVDVRRASALVIWIALVPLKEENFI